MSTRKATVSNVESPTSTGKARPKARSRKAKTASGVAAGLVGRARTSGRRVQLENFVGPGAAVLASGAVAALGYAFKEQIGDLVAEALKGALTRSAKLTSAAGKGLDATRDEAMDAVEKITDQVSMKSLLRYAGLQRRSPVSAVLVPAVGVVLGMAAGSALTYFFGPKLLESFKDTQASAHVDHPTDESHDAPAPLTSEIERPRANGGIHGGMS